METCKSSIQTTAWFLLIPVAAEFNVAGHAPLILGEALLVFLEAIERSDERAIVERSKLCDAHIDANRCALYRLRLLHLSLRLDRCKPFAA